MAKIYIIMKNSDIQGNIRVFRLFCDFLFPLFMGEVPSFAVGAEGTDLPRVGEGENFDSSVAYGHIGGRAVAVEPYVFSER